MFLLSICLKATINKKGGLSFQMVFPASQIFRQPDFQQVAISGFCHNYNLRKIVL